MFKIKVQSKYRATLQAKLQNFIDDKFIRDMQTEVIDSAIKPLISAGVSPVDSVEGGRRFKGYKNPDIYPAKKKAKRPTNLWLTGIMLSWYKAVKKSGRALTLGISSDAPLDVKTRAEANNVGTVTKNGEIAIVARRFIPLSGENYRISVVRKIKNLYARRLKYILSKK